MLPEMLGETKAIAPQFSKVTVDYLWITLENSIYLWIRMWTAK
jgi:hypothetical protein